ncbi:MAG: hypothetical protein ACK5HT_04920 [Draconibacterium sp.]
MALILNQKEGMEYRRFGKTEKHLMTKGNPLTASDTRKQIETPLKDMQNDYLDF